MVPSLSIGKSDIYADKKSRAKVVRLFLLSPDFVYSMKYLKFICFSTALLIFAIAMFSKNLLSQESSEKAATKSATVKSSPVASIVPRKSESHAFALDGGIFENGPSEAFSEASITFGDDLEIEIRPTFESRILKLSEYEINYLNILADPYLRGKVVGVELVDGDGLFLTRGVFYNASMWGSLGWNHISGAGRENGIKDFRVPDWKLSLPNLISGMRSELLKSDVRESLRKEGLRFRINTRLPNSRGELVQVKSGWIGVNSEARNNLERALELY